MHNVAFFTAIKINESKKKYDYKIFNDHLKASVRTNVYKLNFATYTVNNQYVPVYI